MTLVRFALKPRYRYACGHNFEVMMNRLSILGLFTLVLAGTASLAVGCGGDTKSTAKATCTGDCDCTGDTCTCEKGGTCTFGPPEGVVTDDAGNVIDGGATAPLPNDVTYNCEEKGTCDLTCGTGCTANCAGQSTCEGSCTANCTSTCEGTSDCTLSTGINSQVTCVGGSNCNVNVDTGSTVTCSGNSTCAIQCPKGGCQAECAGSTNCTVVCGGTEACQVKCNGQRLTTCPAGQTCSGLKCLDGGVPNDAGGTNDADGTNDAGDAG